MNDCPKTLVIKILLEKFLCRTRRIVRILFGDRSTVQRVPRVATRRPRKLRGERRKQIVDRPADNRIVVHSDVDVNQANGIADTCGAIKAVHYCGLNAYSFEAKLMKRNVNQ